MKTVSFKALLSYPLRSGATVPKEQRGSGVQFVNMKEIFSFPRLGPVDMDRVNINVSDSDRWLLRAGDLLFARRSLTLEGAGKCCLVLDSPENRTWESSIIRARLNPNIADSRYYYYFFSSGAGRKSMEAIVNQVAAAGIKSSDLAELVVPLPDINEQKRVAGVLETLDRKIESNRKTSSILLSLGDALYRQSVVATGVESLIQDVAVFHNNKRRPLSAHQRKMIKGDVPYYGATGVLDYVNEFIFDEVLTLVGEDGSVIDSDGHPVTQYIWGPSWINNHAHSLTGKGCSTEILYFALRASDVTHLITGAVQPKISMSNLKSHTVLLPVSEERERLQGRLGQMMDMYRSVREEIHRLTSMRDALLPSLMDGTFAARPTQDLAGSLV